MALCLLASHAVPAPVRPRKPARSLGSRACSFSTWSWLQAYAGLRFSKLNSRPVDAVILHDIPGNFLKLSPQAIPPSAFPLIPGRAPERPGAVKGAPAFGAAQRTLDGEDRSGKILKEEKDGAQCDNRAGRQFETERENIDRALHDASGYASPGTRHLVRLFHPRLHSGLYRRLRSLTVAALLDVLLRQDHPDWPSGKPGSKDGPGHGACWGNRAPSEY